MIVFALIVLFIGSLAIGTMPNILRRDLSAKWAMLHIPSFNSLFSRQPVRLAIVRRYCDANGNYVGELYMDQTIQRKHDTLVGYTMVGASLDSLPLEFGLQPTNDFDLDTRHDFLTVMPPMTVRIGAINPQDNDRVRRMISDLPRRKMSLVIQNRFIEHVMERRPC